MAEKIPRDVTSVLHQFIFWPSRKKLAGNSVYLSQRFTTLLQHVACCALMLCQRCKGNCRENRQCVHSQSVRRTLDWFSRGHFVTGVDRKSQGQTVHAETMLRSKMSGGQFGKGNKMNLRYHHITSQFHVKLKIAWCNTPQKRKGEQFTRHNFDQRRSPNGPAWCKSILPSRWYKVVSHD